ncbi:hypothetical protein Tco_1247147 [Tanacetum coccineum]
MTLSFSITILIPSMTQQSQVKFPQLDSGLDVPTFQQGEDPIDCINKAMAFLSAVESKFPPSNNQLKTSSNPRNQATIQDGRVTVQQVQGRQTQSFTGTRNKGIATTSRGNYAASQPREKLMLVEEQEAGQILDEEQLAFIADPGIEEAPVAQQTIPVKMTTLAEHIIVAGVENRPPMLKKSMHDSWASRIRLFIKGKKNGRMMLDSIDEGPLVYPTVVGEDGQTRPKKYSELTEAQQLQDDCDV